MMTSVPDIYYTEHMQLNQVRLASLECQWKQKKETAITVAQCLKVPPTHIT